MKQTAPMLKDDPNYRKIRVLGSRGLSSATYWLGTDHLLVVLVDGYTEKYRRIYYRDVQAILTRRTNGWVLLSILFLLLLVVLGILPLTTGDIEGYWLGGINLAIWTPALVVNLVLGPTARCRLRTAVQDRDLPSLTRWRQIERLLSSLVPEIQRAQQTPASTVDEAPPPAAESPAESAVPPSGPGTTP